MFVVTNQQTAVARRNTRLELHALGHQDANQVHPGYLAAKPAGVATPAAIDTIPEEAFP